MAKAQESPWRLFKQALRDYRQHWTLLVGVVLVVSLPVALLTTFKIVETSSDTTAAAYVSFAQLIMNTAIIYAIIKVIKGEELPNVRTIYYQSSQAFLRLFLASVVLVLTLLFFLLGLFIVAAGVIAPNAQLGSAELGLLVGLAIIIALPSLWLLPKSMWALYLVFESEIGPLEAVRASWRLTAGRTWKTLGYLAALTLFLLGLMAVPLIGFLFLQNLTQWPIWEPLLQLTATLLVVPISNLYLYRYLRNMRR
ncbi:MAG TPA: hypothetical protein VF272_02525 [Candidatus Saccharimonadia bacterium]